MRHRSHDVSDIDRKGTTMRKIIGGRRYDTETAKVVAYGGNGLSRSNFHFCRETLYRKASGEYFIYGEGGSLSAYARADGDGYCGGEAIVPFTYDQAREWMESTVDADAYEAEFGEVPEDGGTVQLGVSLSREAGEALARAAAKARASVSEVIEGLVAERLAPEGR